MSVRVVEAGPEEASLLNNLGQLYAHDFSEIVPLELNSAGRFDHDFLRDCWGDGAQTPYLIHVANGLAGFAIVGRGSRVTDDANVHDVSEFFIVRRYRRQGIGTSAAAALFALRRGVWEVRERTGNTAARAFWRRAIGAYSSGHFEELVVEDDRWHGWVQRFVS
jgi:predicted acetyltransferase